MKMTKDWGGKKHMLNPNGTAYSDVWEINENLKLESNNLSPEILHTIKNLVEFPEEVVFLNSTTTYNDKLIKNTEYSNNYVDINDYEFDNKVLNVDCNEFVNTIIEKYPDGVYDIAFSDPPYNLNKNYSKYEDNLRDSEYLNWCEKWLMNKFLSLKPGGSLFVMNIPKWSIHHFNFLSKIMYFDKWIVWDALSTPAGKLMPAHYSILHFVKPGKSKKNNNFFESIPLRTYCLRDSCVKKRTNVEMKLVNDFWRDCHRVKHQKNKNDISEKNIERVQHNQDGFLVYNLPTIKNTKNKTTQNNKLFEESYIKLCITNGKIIHEDDLTDDLKEMLKTYPKNMKKLKSLCKRLYFK
jgi:site-specific DNA-methyltransferase (adenine-specific)